MSADPAVAQCYIHRNQPAEMQCTRCLEYICEVCTLHGTEGLTCPPCLRKAAANRRRTALIVGGICALAVAGIVIGLVVSRPDETAAATDTPPAEAKSGEPEFDYGRYTLQIENLKDTQKKSPCAKRVAIDLGNKLNAAGDYAGAKNLVDEFFTHCESYARLLWVKVYAHEQLGEWAEAAVIDTELIDGKPHDSDFWWWRGKAHAESGNDLQAKADLRQSMAARPNKFAAARYATYFGDDEPCPASFALSFYAEQRADQEPVWATRDAERLYLAGDCDRVAGKGSTSITFKDGSPLIKAQVTINGQSGTFAVSEQTAYVTIDHAFARKAGIELGADQASVFVAEAHQQAQLGAAEVSVGQARAASVTIAAVRELPGGVDGILGGDFLWRFAYDRMDGEITLTSRSGD